MKRFFVLILFLAVMLGTTTAWAATINHPGTYASIQAAIDAASAGDVIQIAAGSYSENFNVNKRVSIIGAGSGSDPITNTIITQTQAGAGDHKIGVIQLNASGLSIGDPILFQDIRILPVSIAAFSVGRFTEATGVSVSYLKFDNIQIYGTNTSPSTEQERGFYVDNTSSAMHLEFVDCAFNNLTYGWYFQKQVSVDTSSVSYITVTNCSFNHNNHKGIYTEKLDHASFYDCTFHNNGYDATLLPTYFYDWCAGVDINLKAGTYSGFIFDNCLITNNGTGGSKEGVGLTVKGRGTGTDSAGYMSCPAYVDDVLVSGCTVTGNERGIRFGEPGKGNTTPTNVNVQDCDIHGNVKTYTGTNGSLYGDAINMTAANSITIDGVVLPAGKATWYLAPGQTIQSAINAAAAGDIIEVPAGIYTEQLHITKNNLTIQGASTSTVTIKSPATLPEYFLHDGSTQNHPVVFVDGVANCTIKNVTVDGDNQGNASYRFSGIAFWNAGGTAEYVDVINVRDNPFSGSQHGVGIYAYNNTSLPTAYTINLNHINVTNYQKTAVALNGSEEGELTVNLDYVTTTGAGPTTITGQNGIQVWGASGSIDNCSISAVDFTGTGWTASGMIVTGPGSVAVNHLDVTDCQTAIYWTEADGSLLNSTITNPRQAGMYVMGTASGIFDVNIDNLELSGNTVTPPIGIYSYATAGTINLQMTNSALHACNYAIYHYPAAPGVINSILEDNDLSGNSYGFVNFAPNMQDASPNYWDTSGIYPETTIDFDPWWANPEMTILDSNAPVENVTQNTFYSTIQAAIDAANPAGGDVIEVAAGTYPENLIVNKRIDLRGPNYGNTPNARDRVPEAIITPSVYVEWGNSIELITADGSSIDGFTFDGNNPLITEQESDIATGIGAFDGIDDLNISNNIIKNYSYDAIELYNWTNSGGMSTGNVVNNNLIDNIYSTDWGMGVLMYNNCYADIINNVMTRVRVGIQTGNYYQADTGDSRDITGNAIQASRNGIFHNLAYSSASAFLISGNTFTVYEPTVNNVTQWHGIRASSLSVPATLAANIINGASTSVSTVGYMIWNDQTPVTIVGGTVSNVDTGINVNNYEGYGPSDAGATYATISNVAITPNAGGTGIYVHDNALSTAHAAAQLTIGANVVVNSGAQSVVVEGTNAVVSSPVANLALNTPTQNYFQLINNANNIDVTDVEFDDLTGAEMTPVQQAAVEAKIVHKFDNQTLGYLMIKSIGLYVDAPEDLIKDNETQIYSVKATYIQQLRGFETQVKIPKVDFNAPTSFTLGSAYSGYSLALLDYAVTTDDNYWLYNVSGSYFGGVSGISGNDLDLFTFSMTSANNASALTGSLVDVPLVSVVLRDEMNGPITCVGTQGKLIFIDSGEPSMIHNNADIYPSGMLLHVLPGGAGLLDRPTLNLTFNDNYNLDYTQYLIQAVDVIAPTLTTQFTLPLGDVDGLTTTLDWQLPSSIDALNDGTYTAYILVVDDAGNYSIYDWDFNIDTTATGPIIWEPQMTTLLNPCRTTPNANNSIDLMWTNPTGTFNNHIWVLSYGDLGSPATGYPEYVSTLATVPAAPNPYAVSPQNGWTKYPVIAAPTAFPYPLTGMERGYYYITVFAEDAAGNISAAPAPVTPLSYYRESISYWPGDVNGDLNIGDGLVQGNDVSLLTGVWGLTSDSPNWNPKIDVGPSTDYARRSRPKPDNRINIEDMMMFSMNYYNTNYTVYPREGVTEPTPIRIEVAQNINNGQLSVSYALSGNEAFVRGLNIPIHYGTGLSLQSVTLGDIWPEDSIMLFTNENNVVEVSASVLGGNGVIEGNGTIATLVFAIEGSGIDTQLMHMIARDCENREIVIDDNPDEVPTDIDDVVNVIPEVSYLGNNYPNPFNPSTTVQYGMKDAGNIRISIFNNRGQLIKTLVNDSKAAGTYEIVWNGRDNNDQAVSSGMYLIRMETKDHVQIKKALLLK